MGSSPNSGGPGGGAVRLSVAKTTTVYGVVTASGANISGDPGSGGSVFITSGAMAGTGGTISANGGSALTARSGGGGGRISLVVTNQDATFNDLTNAVISAYGGTASSGNYPGAAGTVYMETKAQGAGRGTLVVDNNDKSTAINIATVIPSNQTWVVYDLVLRKQGRLDALATSTLNLPVDGVNATAGDATGSLRLYGCSFGWTPATLTISNWTLIADSPYVLDADLAVKSGGRITHTANGSNELYKVDLTIHGNMTVATNGATDVTAKGYAAGQGPGRGGEGTSGSHGGQGANYQYNSSYGPLGPTYGSITSPTNLGSGSKGNLGSSSLPGGGAVILRVSGETRIEGPVTANGGSGNWYPGAGGSIFITTGSLVITNAGTIAANGMCLNSCGSGGGRVAIVLTNETADFARTAGAVISAYGGGPSYPGAAGTVYLETRTQGPGRGTLIADNTNLTTVSPTTLMSSNVTDKSIGDVILRNKGHLRIDTNQTLTVYGSWSNAATFSAAPGSTIVLTGNAASTNTVYGTNVFTGLRCQTPGVTLKFQAGASNAVSESIIWTGTSGSNLVLRSTVPGTQWKLNVMATAATKTFDYVDVQDSDARPSAAAISPLNSVDSGNNSNWSFAVVGETNIWDGDTSQLWTDGGNWSLARAPETFDARIVIPSGCPNYPYLSGPVTINALDLQAGSLRLSNQTFTVNGAATVAGSLVAAGVETITFNSNVVFSASTFTPAQSTVKLNGDGAQSFTPAANTFYALNIANTNATAITDGFTVRDLTFPSSSASVSFGGGFTATNVTLVVSNGASLTFAAGQTYTVRNQLALSGAAGKLVTLTASGAWNLNAAGYAAVRYVNAVYSDARGGRKIYAVNSTDSLNNQNWDFGSGKLWAGATTSWTNDANWLPSGAPGAGSYVLIDGSASGTPRLTNGTTLAGLTVAGLAGTATLTVDMPYAGSDKLTVSGDVDVGANGVLTHTTNGATAVQRLVISVGSNLNVAAGGAINVSERGMNAGGAFGKAASHGGQGAYYGHDSQYYPPLPTYGSVMAPVNLGGSWDSGIRGGGAAALTVVGGTRIEGSVTANGAAGGVYGASGGSIFITTGSLVVTNAGTIAANGMGGSGCSGGGGRVAIVLTKANADFGNTAAAVISAYGGGPSYPGAAGTLYRETAAQGTGRGTVQVDNSNRVAVVVTQIPPGTNAVLDELRFASVIVTNRGAVAVTTNDRIASLAIASTNEPLNLGTNGTVLEVQALTVNGTPYTRGGFYTTNNWNGYSPTPANVTGAGAILLVGTMRPKGTMIFIR